MPRRREYERSPRQRLEWHGGYESFPMGGASSTKSPVATTAIMESVPRLQISTGQSGSDFPVDPVAFPAGIVRGETCAIRRLTLQAVLFDASGTTLVTDGWFWSIALYKTNAPDLRIRKVEGGAGISTVLNPLTDERESYLMHRQGFFWPNEINNQGRNLRIEIDVDSRNSRVFEAQDVLVIAAALAPRGTPAKAITPNLAYTWRALLAMD